MCWWMLVRLACLSTLAWGTALHAAERPNILFIVADNWRWPNASILGDPLARTPAFDRIAREGVLFTNTFNPVPSCSPTRSCLLTGKYAHELGERANLWSSFPKDTPVITELLQDSGYITAYCGKPWGPGNWNISGWNENPVGTKFDDFSAFIARHEKSRPFFFWLGNTSTATRGGKLPFIEEAKATLNIGALTVPPELPDCPEVRDDLLNYYGGVLKLDEEASEAVALLEKTGQLDETVIVYVSDNGWQLPRGLAHCYDRGSHVPLAIRWGTRLTAGRKVHEFVNVADLGPTFLEIAGLTPPVGMTMRSIKSLLLGQPENNPRDAVFIERERHANVRSGNLGYPVRGIRTHDFLYLRNMRPDRWPAGDPDILFIHGRPFGDVDTTRVKDFLLEHLNDLAYAKYIDLIFAKRPSEELYDLKSDPDQLHNVSDKPEYSEKLNRLRDRVTQWMEQTHDPRCDPAYDGFDTFPYYGKPTKRE